MAFIGEPWPTKRAGMRDMKIRPYQKQYKLQIVAATPWRKMTFG
jgi:hypothetical protein